MGSLLRHDFTLGELTAHLPKHNCNHQLKVKWQDAELLEVSIELHLELHPALRDATVGAHAESKSRRSAQRELGTCDLKHTWDQGYIPDRKVQGHQLG